MVIGGGQENQLKLTTLLITLALCITALIVAHTITAGRRYDIVAAGAGSGGSQEQTGSTDVQVFLVDHKTGRSWRILGEAQSVFLPVINLPCAKTYSKSPDQMPDSCEDPR